MHPQEQTAPSARKHLMSTFFKARESCTPPSPRAPAKCIGAEHSYGMAQSVCRAEARLINTITKQSIIPCPTHLHHHDHAGHRAALWVHEAKGPEGQRPSLVAQPCIPWHRRHSVEAQAQRGGSARGGCKNEIGGIRVKCHIHTQHASAEVTCVRLPAKRMHGVGKPPAFQQEQSCV